MPITNPTPHVCPPSSLPPNPCTQLSIKEGEISTGLGSQTKEFDIERQIKIVYLDENLRIARYVAAAGQP